jgi:hypothetical protein
MPLGLLAKDSMVNLAELVAASHNEGDESSALPTGSPGDEAMVQVMPTSEEQQQLDEQQQDEQQLQQQTKSSSFNDTGEGNASIDPSTTPTDEKTAQDAQIPSYPDLQHQQQPQRQQQNSNNNNNDDNDGSGNATTPNDDDEDNPQLVLNPSREEGKASANSSIASMESSSSDAQVAAAADAGKAVGQYTGFTADYHDFENYAYHSNYDPYGGGKDSLLVPTHFDPYGTAEEPWWCCLFPWLVGGDKMIQDDDIPSELGTSVTGDESTQPLDGYSNGTTNDLLRSSSKEDDEISTSSDMFGEKLSDKDRQAVLARLRLAQPDASSNSQQRPTNDSDSIDPPPDGNHQTNQTPKDPSRKSLRKSILVRRSSTIKDSNAALDKLTQSTQSQGGNVNGKARRSLFPSYETKSTTEKKNLHVGYAPMARVVTIKSLKDMDEEEKSRIWWQKPDYEEFRKTGRMITKAMLEGGSEIWLATNQSWQMPNQGKAQTLQHAYSLADRHAAFQKGDMKAKIDYEDTRDKWWHKFGHSRRGLEHIASIDEGRQRQTNVKTSIKAVLDEQRRQQVFHREDPEKLRMAYIQNTNWAKDLALASGASDADAVQKNFDDESRKSREFYLLKFSRANPSSNAPSSTKKVVPAFMKPMMTMPIPANRLDANTHTQIRYRQTQQQQDTPHKRSTSALPDASIRVPIHDDDELSANGSSMAKKGTINVRVLFSSYIVVRPWHF